MVRVVGECLDAISLSIDFNAVGKCFVFVVVVVVVVTPVG